jgi:endonuclease/exonuclease/phosphatase family metal-dependent hydrolase
MTATRTRKPVAKKTAAKRPARKTAAKKSLASATKKSATRPTARKTAKKAPARKTATKAKTTTKTAACRPPAPKRNGPSTAKKTSTRAASTASGRVTKPNSRAARPKKQPVPTRKTVARTKNPNGRLTPPSVTVMREESWSSFWINFKAVHGATGYEMQAARDDSFTHGLVTRLVRSANVRTHFSQLEDGQVYFYRVRALKGDHQGPWSRVGKKELTLYGMTEPATGVEAEGDATCMYVTWLAAQTRSKNPITYRVVMSTDRGGEDVVEEIITTDLRAKFTKAKPNRLYYFRVFASNSGMRERGDQTRWATRTQCSLVPADTARDMRITNISPRGFSARWPNHGPATGYFMEVSDNEEFEGYPNIYMGYAGEKRVGVNDLKPDSTYWVRAINRDGTEGEPHQVITGPEAEELRIGTYNVRYADLDAASGAHGWGKRRVPVAEAIAPHFDIIGVQEAATWKGSRTYRGRNQRDDILHLVKGLTKDDFAVAEMPGSANPGVHVFYRPSVAKHTGEFDHIRWKVGDTNRGQAAVVRLQTIKTGAALIYASVHLSPFVTHEERVEHSLELAERIKTFNTEDLPVVVVGDLNSHAARVDETPKAVLTDPKRSGLALFDAEDWEPRRERTLIHSANTDWKPKIIKTSGHKIDYVLADERIAVTEWDYVSVWTPTGIIRKPHASDHFPVRVIAVLGL